MIDNFSEAVGTSAIAKLYLMACLQCPLCERLRDIDAFKRRLKEKGIPYSDFGTWAMKGWEQIFFYDPDGNIVEVHQVRE